MFHFGGDLDKQSRFWGSIACTLVPGGMNQVKACHDRLAQLDKNSWPGPHNTAPVRVDTNVHAGHHRC